MADKAPVSADSMLNGAAHLAHKAPADVAEQYDLLPKLIPHLDRHLIFPLLEFLSGQEDDDAVDIQKAKLALLQPTNMTDYVANLWKELHPNQEVPATFAQKREAVLAQLQRFSEETSTIDELLNDESVVSNLRSDKVANLRFLEENHGVTVAMVDQLYDYGNFQYNCGNYRDATHLLEQFRILSTDPAKVDAASWGKLAADILSLDWVAVMEEINKLREGIDSKLFNNPLAQLEHRTWLLHWSFFPLFNHEPARDTLVDLFFHPNFINTIQTSCPWVLRYLTVAVVTNRGRQGGGGGRAGAPSSAYQKQLKDLVRVIRQEGYEYRDPITDFIRALYVDFDFEEAQRRLSEAESILQSDFFLISTTEAFVESARHLISESYCKIHQRIDIKDLSARLGLDPEEGEKWIVNLIRDTRVDAKIDYQDGTVLMNHPPQSVYQQVIERTKGGFFRTQVLSAAVAK